MQALNLNCKLITCGDWHQSSINWSKLKFFDSETNIYKDYGIEINNEIPCNPGNYYAANHIRALLDLIVQGNFALAQGMNKDFICNDIYTEEIFKKIIELRNLPNWSDIDAFIGKEYYRKWLKFKKGYNL